MARYVILTPTVKRGESFKVVGIYRNFGTKPVSLRLVPPMRDAEIWRDDVNKTYCVIPGDMPKFDVVLRPGEEYRIDDGIVPGIEGSCFEPGHYRIRFYYDLKLLPDEQRDYYAQKYTAVDGCVAWESEAHSFVVK